MRSKLFSAIVFIVVGAILMLYFYDHNKDENLTTDPLIIIGKDAANTDDSRADTIMVITSAKKEIDILSLPRDSKVAIACNDKNDKLAHAYSIGAINWKNNGGGANCLKQTVNDLLKIEKSFYLEAELTSIANVSKSIGGVKVTPPISFCHDNYCFVKGKQVNIMGEEALAYLRHRSSFKTQDLQRITNGQVFVIALIKQLSELNNLEKTKLVATHFSKFKTDYPKIKILELLDLANGKISTKILKGNSKMENNISYYVLDKTDLIYYQTHYRNLLKEQK